jgi:hypothetical protein
MGDILPFASPGYFFMLALLLFGRGMDFLSTWVATPSLLLEGNPLARMMGWRWGAAVNLILCFTFAFWPLTAIIVITSSLLVAAHNFHAAWLMRSMGEDAYRQWILQRLSETPLPIYFACLVGETFLTALVGAALICVSNSDSIPFSIGFGIVAYSAIVFFYTTLSLWRRRRMDKKGASVLSDSI